MRAIKIWLLTLVYDRRRLRSLLYIVLLILTLSSLCFASILTRQTINSEISKPSLQIYEQLSTPYLHSLRCSCAQASVQYKSFMNLSIPRQHQICSSSFITDEWLSTLIPSDPLSAYSAKDFRKIAIGTFQLLASLCRLSEKYLINEIFNLMARNYINSYLISRIQFDKQMQSIINQFQMTIPIEFLTTLQLIRNMISDNTLMTVFETNWQWTSLNLDHIRDYWGITLYTEPIVYNGSCNCGLSSQCVEQSSIAFGLMIGCYPLEALFKSTLECLYDESCFPQIQSVSRPFQSLNQPISSRYEKNSTVESIVNQLMIEQWTSNIIYEKYYDVCAPISCSYSYIKYRLSLDVLALLLGLYGGLVIIMSVLAPVLTTLLRNIWIRCCRHQSQVQVVELDVTPTLY